MKFGGPRARRTAGPTPRTRFPSRRRARLRDHEIQPREPGPRSPRRTTARPPVVGARVDRHDQEDRGASQRRRYGLCNRTASRSEVASAINLPPTFSCLDGDAPIKTYLSMEASLAAPATLGKITYASRVIPERHNCGDGQAQTREPYVWACLLAAKPRLRLIGGAQPPFLDHQCKSLSAPHKG